MTAPTIHLSIADRARELYATAVYVHTGDIVADIAVRIAVHNWIAATLPNPADGWADYCRSVGLVHDLDAGVVGWQDVEPGLTGTDRHTVALDLAREQMARDLFPLLFGPDAVPCQRCKQTGRDVWSPAVVGGLCCECQAIEWIGGRP